jgi:aryl-alcohol dehydrogenase-like predicted oxidoreductase
MLAVQTYDMTRDEIVALIHEKAARLSVDPVQIITAHRCGELDQWARYADILALAELLEDDDAFFAG